MEQTPGPHCIPARPRSARLTGQEVLPLLPLHERLSCSKRGKTSKAEPSGLSNTSIRFQACQRWRSMWWYGSRLSSDHEAADDGSESTGRDKSKATHGSARQAGVVRRMTELLKDIFGEWTRAEVVRASGRVDMLH